MIKITKSDAIRAKIKELSGTEEFENLMSIIKEVEDRIEEEEIGEECTLDDSDYTYYCSDTSIKNIPLFKAVTNKFVQVGIVNESLTMKLVCSYDGSVYSYQKSVDDFDIIGLDDIEQMKNDVQESLYKIIKFNK